MMPEEKPTVLCPACKYCTRRVKFDSGASAQLGPYNFRAMVATVGWMGLLGYLAINYFESGWRFQGVRRPGFRLATRRAA
jgi:hypothetical protein